MLTVLVSWLLSILIVGVVLYVLYLVVGKMLTVFEVPQSPKVMAVVWCIFALVAILILIGYAPFVPVPRGH